MKHLKIEENKGYFSVDGTEWKSLEEMDKDKLLEIMEKALCDDFLIDEYNEENLANQAHRLIYKSIYEKLSSISSNRSRFQDESKRMYQEAYEKYCTTTKETQ